MNSPGPLAGVGRTALAVARVRARESLRPDRLFDDPYASAFVAAFADPASGEPAAPSARSALRTALGFHVVIRTRFFDDYLLGACAAPARCRQVVLLAAGLDTRAFRLPWPAGVRLFEVDLPDVLAVKDTVLSRAGAVPRCGRTVLGADLRHDWPGALTEAGFDPAQPTAWLAEGLLVYLSADEAAHVLSGVGSLCAPGTRLAFESGGAVTSLVASTGATPATDKIISLWQGGLGQGAADWLARRGWQPDFHALAPVAAAYGRPPAQPSTSSGFITATYLAGPKG